MSGSLHANRTHSAETRPIRHAVLRPNQPPEACVYPGDDAPDSFHLGIRGEPGHGASNLIAVASFYREPLPDDPTGSSQLRIRGMAVLPEHRGKGLGRSLVDAGLAIARDQQPPPTLVWCNARTTAAGYYARLGFANRSGEFEIEGIGPHFVMTRPITQSVYAAVKEAHMSDFNAQHNRVVWFDIPVADLDRAIEFYRAVLGIKVEKQSFDGFEFGVLEHDQGNGGCLVPLPEKDGPEKDGPEKDAPDNVGAKPGPLIYLNTDGRIRDALAKVTQHGGAVTQDIHPIGPHGFRAFITDSEGNTFALHSNTDS